ncbi:MAG TPA: 5-oxoprolinase subunit PxpA [Anaerolineales bacterium]|nr:5-oxoprolinase subunit PxpA [Anaerolineales bacterium]HLO28125.1 5-oxoprolinase subunit PxpA [Anaerolineales bacterium]
MKIDLNCDLGEKVGIDEAIMPYITSANIACGFHAGDETSMRTTVRSAKQYGVAVGVHPGWKDREGFGRREMSVPPDEVEALVLYQIGALYAIAKAEGAELHHVKPHGALYNQAAKDKVLAAAIAGAVKRFSVELILVGLAGSALIEAGVESGLKVASEGFPDRNYNSDGTLISRKQSNAIIESPEEVAAHALRLVQDGISFSRRLVPVNTLCLHGDHPQAAQNAKWVRDALEKVGIEIARL